MMLRKRFAIVIIGILTIAPALFTGGTMTRRKNKRIVLQLQALSWRRL